MSTPPPSPLHALLTERTGMALSAPQRRRLDERAAAQRDGRSEAQYLQNLQSPAGASELAVLINTVVVHKTDLFRDEVQLAAFESQVLAPRVARGGRPLRVWSAGCATGEEVATLLVMLAEAGADPNSTVLGTDISEPALARARTLSFGAEQMRRVPSVLRDRWFTTRGANSSLVPVLRERASFQFHNLMDAPYPSSEDGAGFDIIFCRNVLIYFTPEAFALAVARLSEQLAPGGTLVLSAAEPLLQVPPPLRAQHSTNAFFYVRTEEPESPDAARERAGRSRDSGRFASLSAAEPPRVSGAFPSLSSAESPRVSGAFPSLTSSESPRVSGAFPSLASSEPPRVSGAFPSLASSEPPRVSGSFPSLDAIAGRRDSGGLPAVAPARDSGRFATIGSAPPSRESGRFAAVSPPLPPPRDSGRFAAVAPTPPPVRDSGRFAAVPPAEPPPVADAEAHAEASALFARVLEGSGEGGEARSEDDLRRCLGLDADLAAARFLLGMMLELRDAPVEASIEYRRALRSLEEGRARAVPFFLNPVRLRTACARAIERTVLASRPR
ncbi:CheR family methyltransferase [Myxococcaceae bacterium GXIMD 01537]